MKKKSSYLRIKMTTDLANQTMACYILAIKAYNTHQWICDDNHPKGTNPANHVLKEKHYL